METKPSKSIHDLPPLEVGGVIARNGFHIQDHVAAGFCITMLSNPELVQVWCETQDDITLLWNKEDTESVEFVQVKSNELDQLWSIAELCKREKSKGDNRPGVSILERSLAYDRCSEPCSFRIVTCRPAMNELAVLLFPIGSTQRSETKLNILKQQLNQKVNNFLSTNGHGPSHWVDRTTWDVRHAKDSIKNVNILNLKKIIEEKGELLALDQLEELYTKLLAMVQTAALASYTTNATQKKICKSDLCIWFQDAINTALHPAITGSGKRLKLKMETANIPADCIDTALELRRKYRSEVLEPQYMDSKNRQIIEDEAQARLNILVTKLDAGLIKNNGQNFHCDCLNELQTINTESTNNKQTPSALLQGFMYNLADRCLHRFRKAQI
ncbi:MAG: dsDNA nuclease domain-containing protein [Sedimentisphaerales bacterium]